MAPRSNPVRVAFETLGCRSNFADTVDLQAAILEKGGVPTTIDQEADVYVINTCTVTDDADKTALLLVRRVRAQSPNARIVVTGCMAETSPDVISSLGIADAVIGPGKKGEVVSAIFADAETEERSFTEEALSAELAGPGSRMGEVTTRARFHLRVQEGCENFCTFCIIPASRGELKSRPIPLVLDDLRALADRGYEEVVLTGTHLGGYGEDIGTNLAALLAEIAVERPIGRIRLSSLDPNDLTVEIVDILAKSHVFCPHLHICVQAFSDPVLKRMARRYRLDWVYEILGHITDRLPECCLGSDVIAGFPGESRQDVEQAIQVFLGLPFSYLHVFPYSERTNTPATRLDGSVDTAERKRRTARWRALSESRRREFSLRRIGRTLEVILEAGDGPVVHGISREFAAVQVAREQLGEWKPGEKRLLEAQSYDEAAGRIVCV